MRPSIFAAILAICLSGQAAAKDLSDDDADLAIQKASQFLNSGDPAHAVQAVEPIISELERRAKGDRVVYCGSTQAAILATMATAASQNKSAVAYPLAWCSALFVKGFALIDLHRAAEAEPFLRRATEFAPY